MPEGWMDPCCNAGGPSVMPAESDTMPEPCMGTVTRSDFDDEGQGIWLITSLESEVADVVVFGKDLQKAGMTQGLVEGDFVSYLKVYDHREQHFFATDVTVFKP